MVRYKIRKASASLSAQDRLCCAGWPGLAGTGTNRDILLYDSGLRSVGVALRTPRTRWVLPQPQLGEIVAIKHQADIRKYPREAIQTDFFCLVGDIAAW